MTPSPPEIHLLLPTERPWREATRIFLQRAVMLILLSAGSLAACVFVLAIVSVRRGQVGLVVPAVGAGSLAVVTLAFTSLGRVSIPSIMHTISWCKDWKAFTAVQKFWRVHFVAELSVLIFNRRMARDANAWLRKLTERSKLHPLVRFIERHVRRLHTPQLYWTRAALVGVVSVLGVSVVFVALSAYGSSEGQVGYFDDTKHRIIKGTVEDAENKPVPNITVQVKGGSKAITDKNGTFVMNNVPVETEEITLSYPEMRLKKTIKIKPDRQVYEKFSYHPKRNLPAELNPAPAPTFLPQTTPTPPRTPTPTPTPTDDAVAVVVLSYHDIEKTNPTRNPFIITTAEFKKEMHTLGDKGFNVIPMQDLLAWQRHEKRISVKSCVITIDDGFVSAYATAWPVLKTQRYPFTLFIYLNYIGNGGRALSWKQIAEMSQAGVDIGSQTYSHANLTDPTNRNYVDRHNSALVEKDIRDLGRAGWMRKEIVDSKHQLEKQLLGIKVTTFVYPYGGYDDATRKLVKEAGYEAAFIDDGKPLTRNPPPSDLLSRYTVMPGNFEKALSMIAGSGGDSKPAGVGRVNGVFLPDHGSR